MNPKKRLLSITLIVVMLVALLPAAVLAEDTIVTDAEVSEDDVSEIIEEIADDLVVPTATEDVSDIADEKESTLELSDILPEMGAEDINTREETELTDLEQELQPASKQLMQEESDNNLIVQDGIKYNVLDADQKLLEVAGFEDENDSRSELVLPKTIGGAETTYTVVSIGREAFSDCSSLSKVNFPAGLESIGIMAFQYCTSLTAISLPASLTSIGNHAFYKCSSLSKVNFPAGLESIGIMAFRGCTSLTAISLPDSLTSLGSSAFNSCTSLKDVKLSQNLKRIENLVFYNCSSLESIVLPDGIETIGSDVFSSCTSLSTINFPSSLTNIGERAFFHCSSLSTINFPSSLTNIGEGAFENCSSLREIDLSNSHLTKIEYNAFGKCRNVTNIYLPDSLTQIDDNVFQGCSSLSAISLPDSLTYIGYRAFMACTSLQEVFVGKGLESIFENTFENTHSNLKYSTNSPRVQLLLLDELSLAQHPYYAWDGIETIPDRAIGTLDKNITINDAVIELGGKVILDNVTINLEGTLEFAEDTLEGSGTIVMGENADLSGTLPEGIEAIYYVKEDFPDFLNTDKAITATINADIAKLEGVTIGGQLLQAGVDYNAESGSTIITLLPEYLKTLPYGSYDVGVDFADGYADLSLDIKATYTMTYTDGITDEEIFADQVYEDIKQRDATPVFNGIPERKGYIFIGWEPQVAETVTEDVTYVAQWEQEDPIPTTKPTETGKPSQSETAKTDKQAAPKTGENMNLMLPIMFIVTAVLLVLSVIVIRKREQDKT